MTTPIATAKEGTIAVIVSQSDTYPTEISLDAIYQPMPFPKETVQIVALAWSIMHTKNFGLQILRRNPK